MQDYAAVGENGLDYSGSYRSILNIRITTRFDLFFWFQAGIFMYAEFRLASGLYTGYVWFKGRLLVTYIDDAGLSLARALTGRSLQTYISLTYQFIVMKYQKKPEHRISEGLGNRRSAEFTLSIHLPAMRVLPTDYPIFIPGKLRIAARPPPVAGPTGTSTFWMQRVDTRERRVPVMVG